jgi:hypothetical protein
MVTIMKILVIGICLLAGACGGNPLLPTCNGYDLYQAKVLANSGFASAARNCRGGPTNTEGGEKVPAEPTTEWGD